MKTMRNLFVTGALGMLACTLNSCDEDHYYYEERYDYAWRDRGDNGYNQNNDNSQDNSNLVAEAQCLRGHWQGLIVYEYTDEQTGQRATAKFNADMEFDQYDNSTNPLRGRGREIDTAGEETQELRFMWYIEENTGNIYIKYDGSGKTYVMDAASQEKGFFLDSDNFYGYMIGVGMDNDDLLQFAFTRYTLARETTGDAPATTKRFSRRNMNALNNTQQIPFRLLKR